MALQLNATASCFYNYYGTSNNNQKMNMNQGRNVIRAVTSVEDNTSTSTSTATSSVEKIKLGGSDLDVTKLGIGAWSWGDTSYWNNFERDGIIFFFLFLFLFIYYMDNLLKINQFLFDLLKIN